MKWSTIKSLLNQLMVICIEANLADLISLTFTISGLVCNCINKDRLYSFYT
jgi:hypothetical protein